METINTVLQHIIGRLFVKPKITIDLCRHHIQNVFLDQQGKMGHSEVEIILRISNAGRRVGGISKILVRSKDPNYLIAVSCFEYRNEWKNHPLPSFKLEPEETKMVILSDMVPIISIEKKFVEAEIEIYGANQKILKTIPIKLYIGSVYRGS